VGWTASEIRCLRTLLEGRAIGGRIVYRDVVSSTMDEAAALADAGHPEGTVVLAEQQTAGRGRLDRSWVTGPGENIAFSVVLRPDRSRMSQLNMAATLGVASAVERLTGVEATVKWPNDVRIGGKKLAGILIESAMDAKGLKHAVLGIGINVNLDPSAFPEIAGTATSLMAETGAPLDRGDVLRAVLEDVDDRYTEVRGGKSLTDRWARRLDTLGSTVRVRWRDSEMVGCATGVDDDGNLLLTGPDGSVRKAIAGEVTLQT
jgi:BirA family biotin operon repressor/biotin-[acetyl-CoA-carboxylase] ligase